MIRIIRLGIDRMGYLLIVPTYLVLMAISCPHGAVAQCAEYQEYCQDALGHLAIIGVSEYSAIFLAVLPEPRVAMAAVVASQAGIFIFSNGYLDFGIVQAIKQSRKSTRSFRFWR